MIITLGEALKKLMQEIIKKHKGTTNDIITSF